MQHLVACMVEIAGIDHPLLHLPLGADAIGAIEGFDRRRLEELNRWRLLSMTTGFGG